MEPVNMEQAEAISKIRALRIKDMLEVIRTEVYEKARKNQT